MNFCQGEGGITSTRHRSDGFGVVWVRYLDVSERVVERRDADMGERSKLAAIPEIPGFREYRIS